MSPVTISSFVAGLLQSQLLDAEQREEVHRLQVTVSDSRALAQELLRRDWLTAFQINQIFQGKGAGLLLGSYFLLDRLGEGGMGQVFKARQKMLQRVVALKIIRPEYLDNPKAIKRFQREIRAASQLSHPHIVRAYDADHIQGTYYFAMELVEGADLSRLIQESGPMRVDRACEYIRQAALGLQHALERGMVHRDIKPANLLVTRTLSADRRRSSGSHSLADLHAKKNNALQSRSEPAAPSWGIVKILDMGLARCADPFTGQAATHLTQIGSVMGTPDFIAPEQARDSHSSDIRSDLYSLGCTLYFLLAGQPPFPNGTVTEKLLQHQSDEPEPISRVRRARLRALQGPDDRSNGNEEMLPVPAPVAAVVARLMAKEPQDRYQTPQELATVLQTLLQQMADGTLPRGKADLITDTVEMPAMPPSANPEDMMAATVIQPITAVRSPGWPLFGKARLALVLAGGFALFMGLALTAALMNRTAHTHASPVSPVDAVKNVSR